MVLVFNHYSLICLEKWHTSSNIVKYNFCSSSVQLNNWATSECLELSVYFCPILCQLSLIYTSCWHELYVVTGWNVIKLNESQINVVSMGTLIFGIFNEIQSSVCVHVGFIYIYMYMRNFSGSFSWMSNDLPYSWEWNCFHYTH